SVLSFFTLKSYFAITIVISVITAHASWCLFKLIHQYGYCNEKLLAIGVLFLPSVNFWCSGISKDAIVFIAIAYMVTSIFSLISGTNKKKLKHIVIIIIMGTIIFKTRPFILIAIMVPLFFSFSAK